MGVYDTRGYLIRILYERESCYLGSRGLGLGTFSPVMFWVEVWARGSYLTRVLF